MILSIDEVNDILDTLADGFPPPLFDGLNGGVSLLEECRQNEELPGCGLYVLGEYCSDSLGHHINIFYGSFVAVAGGMGWSREDWASQLRETLSHELTHHMEYRSGTHALEDQDSREMEEYRRIYGGTQKQPGSPGAG